MKNPCDTNPGMRPIRATGLFTILLCMLWVSPAAAANLATFNVEIPPGKWKSARLKNLPKDAAVAVQVVSNGEITVTLVDSKGYQRPFEISSPLFVGQVEKRLAFSVSIPAQGDYFLVLNNRAGRESRLVSLTVRAARGNASQTKTAEEVLKNFELQLHRVFLFKPFPIGIKKCVSPKAFLGASGIFLCEGYVHHLYDLLKDKQIAKDTLSFSLFHEVARILLAQWGHPSPDTENVADEFAAVLMIMFNQKQRIMAAADYFVRNPSVSETFSSFFFDQRHPPSVERAKNILSWVTKDTELVLKWQGVVVPHMQTALLKKLLQQPAQWTDLSLVETELSKRGGGKKVPI